MILAMIAAMARNRVIGRSNQLPWHLPEDLKHFKKITMGCSVMMGRKTFESIGRLLPGRRNIILSRQKDYRVDGALIVPDLHSALAACTFEEKVFIIGGAQLYQEALPLAQLLYLTLIDRDFEGDAYFPSVDLENDFRVVTREEHESKDFRYSFLEAKRVT